MYIGFKGRECKCTSDITIGNEFHNEIVLGTKECKKEFVCAKG